MNDNPHRNIQNLKKIGPVYSTIDEKQRNITEEILNFKVRPELKVKLNMNIPGLERKKVMGVRNPGTYRYFTRLAMKGREGWIYIWTMPNITRFWTPFMCALLLYYAGQTLTFQVYYSKELNNMEWEGCYPKMQTIPSHYFERFSLMA